ncbi:MAG: dTDP-4-dehydrorhamnose 3,5-epimerase family protein [Myxococcota bacterium]
MDSTVRGSWTSCETIEGVSTFVLESHRDERGELTEVFRSDWVDAAAPRQWNVIRSTGNSLRGVHVHIRHTDYVSVLDGAAIIGLKDLRRGSPTHLKDACIAVDAGSPRLLRIPPGVAHGFYTPEASLLCVAASEYFDPADDLGYRWDDTAALLFPEVRDPIVSERDATAPPFVDLLAQLEPHQPGFGRFGG